MLTLMLQPYVPILVLIVFVVANAILMLGLSHLLSNYRRTAVKIAPYESGMPVLGDARERFSVKFYLVAMLFIRFDIARFGMERQSFSPRQADVLICAGRLPFKLAPVIRRIWDQMPQPKWSISMGACASTGGIFDNYSMVQGIDTIIPVDVYVPGCPPRPEGLLYGILLLHKKIKGESLFDRVPRRDEQPLDDHGLRLPPEQIDEISEPFGNSIHQFRSA